MKTGKVPSSGRFPKDIRVDRRAISDFTSLYPYYRTVLNKRYRPTINETKVPQDTLFKYQPGTVINLNEADTTELKKIPGIGSAIARMIVNYRTQLGGFYKIEQLQEKHLKQRCSDPGSLSTQPKSAVLT